MHELAAQPQGPQRVHHAAREPKGHPLRHAQPLTTVEADGVVHVHHLQLRNRDKIITYHLGIIVLSIYICLYMCVYGIYLYTCIITLFIGLCNYMGVVNLQISIHIDHFTMSCLPGGEIQ